MKDPVFFEEHVQQDAQETLSKLLRLLPLSYQRHFEGVQVDNRHCECGAAAATTCEMLGVSIPVISRSLAQGACGVKQFSWNANTREVSEKHTGFMWFLVSFPLKLSQVRVPLGSIDQRYI